MQTAGPVHSFPPIARRNARILILGSMPGAASLAAGQYYAHPRNAFWTVMGRLCAFDPGVSYARRCQHLLANRIAVWDVLRSCVRSSSLDADIVDATIMPNDFPAFFASHPRITRVYFNGGKAENVYRRLVQPQLPETCGHIEYQRLPSTSPAHAALDTCAKIAAWRKILA